MRSFFFQIESHFSLFSFVLLSHLVVFDRLKKFIMHSGGAREMACESQLHDVHYVSCATDAECCIRNAASESQSESISVSE